LFELHITCSKDIDELSINFTDGTVKTVKSSKQTPKQTPKPRAKNTSTKTNKQPSDDFLNTDDCVEITPEIVALPKINNISRSAKVAPELQNLDI